MRFVKENFVWRYQAQRKNVTEKNTGVQKSRGLIINV